MITEVQINLLKEVIVETMHPERIYIFGSYATGIANEDSDLDILIEIESSDLRSAYRSAEVNSKLDKYKHPHFSKDIFVYTCPEVEKFSNNKYLFLSSILKSSKLIYEC